MSEGITLNISEKNNSGNINEDRNVADDVNAILDLIQSDTANNIYYNYKGSVIGAGLLGSGVLLSIASLCLARRTEYKHRNLTKKLCTMLAIPLTTSGLVLTTYFMLNVEKTQNEQI